MKSHFKKATKNGIMLNKELRDLVKAFSFAQGGTCK